MTQTASQNKLNSQNGKPRNLANFLSGGNNLGNGGLRKCFFYNLIFLKTTCNFTTKL